MIPLTTGKNKSCHEQNICYICKKEFSANDNDNRNIFKLYHRVRDNCHYSGKYRGASHGICNLRDKTPKEMPVVFHSGSTYDYHFIIKDLAELFKGQFECLGKNTGKYRTFSVAINKELENNKTIIYKTKFIDSFRFVSRSLSNLLDIFLKDSTIINVQIVSLVFNTYQPKMNY